MDLLFSAPRPAQCPAGPRSAHAIACDVRVMCLPDELERTRAIDRLLRDSTREEEGFPERLGEAVWRDFECEAAVWLLDMFRLRAEKEPEFALKVLRLYVAICPQWYTSEAKVRALFDPIMEDPAGNKIYSDDVLSLRLDIQLGVAKYALTVYRGAMGCLRLTNHLPVLRLPRYVTRRRDPTGKLSLEQAKMIVRRLLASLRILAIIQPSDQGLNPAEQMAMDLILWVRFLSEDDDLHQYVMSLGNHADAVHSGLPSLASVELPSQDNRTSSEVEDGQYDCAPVAPQENGGEPDEKYLAKPLSECTTVETINGKLCATLSEKSYEEAARAILESPSLIDALLFSAIALLNGDARRILANLTARNAAGIFGSHIMPALQRLVDNANARLQDGRHTEAIESFRALCAGLAHVVCDMHLFSTMISTDAWRGLCTVIHQGEPIFCMTDVHRFRRGYAREQGGYEPNTEMFCEFLRQQTRFLCSRITCENNVVDIEMLEAWLSLMFHIASVHESYIDVDVGRLIEDALHECRHALGSVGLAICTSSLHPDNLQPIVLSSMSAARLLWPGRIMADTSEAVTFIPSDDNEYVDRWFSEVRILPSILVTTAPYHCAFHRVIRSRFLQTNQRVSLRRIIFVKTLAVVWVRLVALDRGIGMTGDFRIFKRLMAFCGFDLTNVELTLSCGGASDNEQDDEQDGEWVFVPKD